MAIGVLDLLPHAVSAVYFIYDQNLERFSFGKLSALHEAALTVEGQYQYYYMGYYIHSCQKMRYKAEFKPQYILDLESMDWKPLNDPQVRKNLDENEGKSNSSEAKFPSPIRATSSGESVLDLGLLGAMTVEDIISSVSLGDISTEVHVAGRTLIVPLNVSAFEQHDKTVRPQLPRM